MHIQKEWFASWFDSPYYDLLYQHRNLSEAQNFVNHILQTKHLKNFSSFIDVCCGKGRHTNAFAQHFKKLVGLDYSHNSIQQAKKNTPHAHVSFYQHDMRQPFHLSNFDLVFNAFTSFGYAQDEQENDAFFTNMTNLLAPQGVFIFDYINVHNTPQPSSNPQHQTFNNTSFTIHKHQDNHYFYKQIIVHDANNNTQHEFTERIKKYTQNDLTHKLLSNNLHIINTFGDYDLNPFQKNASPRIIFFAQKI